MFHTDKYKEYRILFGRFITGNWLYIYKEYFFIFSNLSIVRNRCHKTAKFQDILPRLTLEKESNRWKIAKEKRVSLRVFVAMATVCNMQCEYPELNCKAETIGPFLVLQPSSGVHTFNNLGSHLKLRS